MSGVLLAAVSTSTNNLHTLLLRTVQVHWVVLYLAADISQTLEDNKLDLVNNMLFKTSTVVKKSPT